MGEQVAARVLGDQRRTDYEGHVFERVCAQWVARQARAQALPLMVTKVDSWWGTDPARHEQTDVDLVASDEFGKRDVLVGECTWRESFDETEVLKTLRERAMLVGDYERRWHYVFSERPVGEASLAKATAARDARFVCVEEMLEG